MNRSNLIRLAALTLALTLPVAVSAKVPAEEAAKLDGDTLTCAGAIRAGSDSGVAAYTGQWLDGWPGMAAAEKSGYTPGPYAAEKPLFTITADNMAQYAGRLTPGQQKLLQKYPQGFRMPVYPSHRDFRMPDWACEVTRKNALSAQVKPNGKGLEGLNAGIAFPFPANGLEAVWNVATARRPASERVVNDIAVVYPNGDISMAQQYYMSLNQSRGPDNIRPFSDKIQTYFLSEFNSPPRDKGFISTGWQPNDFTDDATSAWQYLPGTRRVRQAPNICCDYPVPPTGMHTVDDNYIFNGSPERYDWKLVGRQEFYMPAHMFRINDQKLSYDELLGAQSINPELLRFELHRVWVIEGHLKPGMRHVYKKRVIYADEDTWLPAWGDNYDGRGELWRIKYIAYRYAPDAQAYHRTVAVYHDLKNRAYEATYLVNQVGKDNWWRVNDPSLRPEMFGPKAAQSRGR
ncbi:DUF1329 domain-containing protein [Solimonas sp. K1W22B-7]|uniref:DUF1329 domain-containing protein n=1 Tax=Solimonas sp. K1W22B-7 TaxID=2303331 RepID=UPI000E33240E|nr:DUF1329 domain-containing protein [Solimonas sp. K1W22B-7]AXQ31010.1 DUF1329 domain-containing protein [Solimonas sp. K1W22B-7]